MHTRTQNRSLSKCVRLILMRTEPRTIITDSRGCPCAELSKVKRATFDTQFLPKLSQLLEIQVAKALMLSHNIWINHHVGKDFAFVAHKDDLRNRIEKTSNKPM